MTTLTLLTKAYSTQQLNQIADSLQRAFEDLDVEAKVLGTVGNKWVQIALSGEDEGIAASYIAKETGLCPNTLADIKKFSTLKGYVTNFERNREELTIDIGVFQPKTTHATVPLRHLQAQLVDGRKVALATIGELFAFCENMPINIKVTRLNESENRIEAELSTRQVETYLVWREALLDKLIIIGATLHEAEKALEYARLNRDVVNVESLGMFEHVLTCKLGTDAAGLIPKIGRILKNARFTVFNPKKLMSFLQG
ncbi:MAG: DUF2110 family protein [Candidatus Bathyarchaeota archaeon]|nr:DUF2110 family protein [Candidatus Bathyarchaeota archaeon]